MTGIGLANPHPSPNPNPSPNPHLDQALDHAGRGLVGLAVLGGGEGALDAEDEERGDVADDGEAEAVVVVEVLGDDDRRDDRVVARPRRVVDADREDDDDEEARKEDEPDQAAEDLGGLGRHEGTRTRCARWTERRR